jgi:lysophospholipase L1-like esterase
MTIMGCPIEGFVSMKCCSSLSCLIISLTMCSTPQLRAQQQAAERGSAHEMAVRDGDTVVFYGDSITALHLYTRFAEEFMLTRYPPVRVRFVNAGVPGDATYGGYAGTMQQRIQRDVTAFHPAMITVMLGMNDGGYVPMTPQIDAAFRKGFNDLLDTIIRENPRAALTLILPTPYDEITHGTEFPGYSKTIDGIASDVAEIAAQRKAAGQLPVFIVDFHRPLVDSLTRATSDFPALAPLMIPDRIHPAAAAQWIMAAALMQAWHVDPVVSDVTLSAVGPKVTDVARTKISGLQKTPTGLQWSQLDEALPLPLDLNDTMTSVLLKESVIESLDRQMMRVRDLAAGTYELWIDQKRISTFSAGELEHGVNLALLKTPMLDQARGIDWEEDRRATLDLARFILSAETAKQPDATPAEERLLSAEEELAATISRQAAPKVHTFEIRRRSCPVNP